MFFKIGVLKNFANFIGKHQCWSIFRSSCWQVFFKVGILKNFIIFTEKHLCRSLFFINYRLQVTTLTKSNSYKVFSCEYCQIFKNSSFYRTPVMAASVSCNKVAGLKTSKVTKKRVQHRCFPVKFAKVLRTPFLQNTSGDCF